MSLSDKIVEEGFYISIEDVKQFIKELKERIAKRQGVLEQHYNYEDSVMNADEVVEIMDELAGEGLIWYLKGWWRLRKSNWLWRRGKIVICSVWIIV